MYSTTNHPIIPNPPNSVRYETDENTDTFFATISSLDRNVVKYPHASSFTIDLPQGYNNVTSMSLQNSYFPNVCDNFNLAKNNVDLVFRFVDIPITPSNVALERLIYTFIKQGIDNNNYYRIRITDGSYTQQEITLEVQNRMNQIIIDSINEYYSNNANQDFYQWGDYKYKKSGTLSADNNMVMILNSYSSYDEALASYHATLGSSTEPLNLTNVNNFIKKYGSTLTPPPLVVVPTTKNTTDGYLGSGIYDQINGAASGSYSDYVKQQLSVAPSFNHFKLFYDKIQNKTIFGCNIASFEVLLDFTKYYSSEALEMANIKTRSGDTCTACDTNKVIRIDYINWGLPIYMGFSGKEHLVPFSQTEQLPTYYAYDKDNNSTSYTPFQRATSGNFSTSNIYILTPCNKLNIQGELYYYMEIDGINMIDELLPYNNNAYAVTNGTSTGVISSIFAKRSVVSTITEQYKEGKGEEKTFTPALRRINKVSVRIRYHDGREPNFGSTPLDFTLKLTCQKNQIARSANSAFMSPA